MEAVAEVLCRELVITKDKEWASGRQEGVGLEEGQQNRVKSRKLCCL
jgi:hypothetical protein